MNSLTRPDPRSWYAGTAANATLFNQLADAFEWAIAPPELWILRVANFTMNQNGNLEGVVPFDKVLIDTCATLGSPMWNSANNTRMVVQVEGWYEIMMQTTWNSSTDFFRRIHTLNVNWNGAVGLQTCPYETVSNKDFPVMVSECAKYLYVGDYLELQCYADTASSTLTRETFEGTNDYRYPAMVHMKWVSL